MFNSSPWSKLSKSERTELVRLDLEGRLDTKKYSKSIGMKQETLERRLREHRQMLEQEGSLKTNHMFTDPSGSIVNVHEDEIAKALKKAPMSLRALSDKFNLSPSKVEDILRSMQEKGYVISEERGYVELDYQVKAQEMGLPGTLADQEGHIVTFAVASDQHSGSNMAQPTALNKFCQIAYEEYGVRHFFNPGDLTAGIFGYRGQEHDLIPEARPLSRAYSSWATRNQVWLADAYIPKMDGAVWYMIGGNHDAWHITNSGIDPLRAFAQERDDVYYLGYDVADVPLTDRVDIRMWHPSGGVPYALTYRIQKGLESMAFEELSKAIAANENPKLRFLLAGHLHVEAKFNRGPFVAAVVGCFEGQTNYLKRKGLYPEVGGSIFRVWITDSGMVQRTEYTFIPFQQIEEDWKNWPVPQTDFPGFGSVDSIDTIFSLE
jgi:hypothetical protein